MDNGDPGVPVTSLDRRMIETENPRIGVRLRPLGGGHKGLNAAGEV